MYSYVCVSVCICRGSVCVLNARMCLSERGSVNQILLYIRFDKSRSRMLPSWMRVCCVYACVRHLCECAQFTVCTVQWIYTRYIVHDERWVVAPPTHINDIMFEPCTKITMPLASQTMLTRKMTIKITQATGANVAAAPSHPHQSCDWAMTEWKKIQYYKPIKCCGVWCFETYFYYFIVVDRRSRSPLTSMVFPK